MTQVTRLVATAIIAVVITVGVMTFTMRPAAAQSAVVTCSVFNPVTNDGKSQQVWMLQQIQSGRTHFVTIEKGLCSW